MRLIIQKFGFAVGVIWTAILGICWLVIVAIALLGAANVQQGLVMLGAATGVTIVAVFVGWLIVGLWIWIFEP